MSISPKARKLDMQGYVVLPGEAIDQIGRYAELINGVITSEHRPGKFHFMQFDPEAFTWVLDNQQVMDLVSFFCGPHARLDNHFCFAYPGEGVSPNIHGGPFNEGRSVYYHSQGMYHQTSNLKVGIVMQPQRGVAFVPGSHKTNLAARGCTTEQSELVKPRLAQGDIIVFTDALVHGTTHHEQQRQILYYTFTPGHVAWAEYEEPKYLAMIPEHRRRFFRKPGLVQLDPEDRANIRWKEATFQVKSDK